MKADHDQHEPVIVFDTCDEAAYRSLVRDWLERNLPEKWRETSFDYALPTLEQRREWEAKLAEAGFVCVTWPKAYGGQGRPLSDHLIVMEEMGRLAFWESVNSGAKEMMGALILKLGTEKQKKRFLPNIVTMKELWCQGFSEPEAGSDLSNLKTRAVKNSDGGWVVNGQKIWTSHAQRSDWCMLLARTGPPGSKSHGISIFAVPMSSSGIEVVPIRRATGGAEFNAVFFNDVRLEEGSNIGEIDAGWAAAVELLANERGTNRMFRAARFENEIRHLIEACKSDMSTAKLLEESYYRQRVGRTFAEIEIIRRLVRFVIHRLEAGQPIGQYGSIIKLYWSEAHRRFTELAVELLDRATVPNNPAIAQARRRFGQLFLHVQSETVQAGTTQIQLDLIARNLTTSR